ncbi:MAG TPA: hypothetical protein VFE96_09950, partial [Candidatus Bathyarchaeia archaeon]|nr:hypothetical protein [Candidatus Bathyarchaeia archaeon]
MVSRYGNRPRIFFSVAALTATLLTILPGSYIGITRVNAFNQDVTIPTTQLPFGPEVDQILFQYYSDFQAMFNAFTSGGSNGLDITDWPMFAADSGINTQTGSLCDSSLHPDFYCGSTGTNFGLFQVDINHDRAFLGMNQFQPRTTSVVSVAQTIGPAGCSPGFGSISVQLRNQETNARDQLFAVNNMTLTQVLSGGVLAGATTLSGTSGTGLYNFPCVVAGTYLLSNSAYMNCKSNIVPCEVHLGSASTNTAIFYSNWNSPSTQQYTLAGIYLRQALRHLVDKPKFILGQTLLGQAQCTDIYAARPQGFATGFCSGAPNVPRAPLPADILNAECPLLTNSETLQGIPSTLQLACTPVDAYTLNETAIGETQVWWAATGPLSDNGYPSKQDLRAACDLLVLAGFSVTPTGKTCIDVATSAQGAAPPCTPTVGATSCSFNYPHLALPGTGVQIIVYVRTHPPREAFGQIMVDGLNYLFGTANNGPVGPNGVIATNPAGAAQCAVNYGFKSPAPGCAPAYYRFTEISDIIFADGVNAQTWNLYTGGESFSINPDNEYAAFNSGFAS